MSEKTLLVSTGITIEILSYSQTLNKDEIILIDRICLESVPTSLASFNQSNIVLLCQNLIILNSKKETIFTTVPPINGKLLSNNKINSPFFLIGCNQIFRVELPNVKEQIKVLVSEFKFEKAYELTERFKLDYSEVLYPNIEYYMKLQKFEDAARLVNEKLNHNDKFFVNVIQSFCFNHKLHLIAKSIPYIEDENLNNFILSELGEYKDLLKEFIQKWPLTMLTKSSMITKIKKLGFNDVLIDNFLKLGKTTEALKVALDVKSIKCFEILEKYPETFTLFLEIPNFLSELFALDCFTAGNLCETNHMEIPKVLEWLPSELIIKFLLQYQKLDLELEKILFEELLKYSPELLFEFINKVKFLSLDYILSIVQNSKLDSIKVHILRKLNNEAEVSKILNENFDVRLAYIKYYPDLWPDTLKECKNSIQKTRKVLQYLHLYSDSLNFIKDLEFKEYEGEIKEFIKKQGKIVDIYKNSLSASKLEEFHEFQLLYKEYCRGILYNPPFVCCRCAQPLTSARLRKCGHHSHKDCCDKCIFCIDPNFLTQ